MPARYQYTPLSPGDYRLFILEPSNPNDLTIRIRMTTRSMYFDSYETISWTGSYSDRISILIDGLEFDIPPELHSAITALRSPEDERVLWADAICLNMPDLEERHEMILKFGKIFQQSSRVCIWLGAEDLTSNAGMKFIRQCSVLDDTDSLVRGSIFSESWDAVLSLMERRLFSRTWIIQEVAMAPSAILLCGSDSATWLEFEACVDLFEKRSLLYPQNYQIQSLPAHQLVHVVPKIFEKDYQNKIVTPRLTLQTLVTRLSNFEATDPRDRIFSLMGLALDTGVWPGENHFKDFTISYNKSTEEVYNDFFLNCVNSSGSLDLLFRPWAPPSLRDRLPTWICTTDASPFGGYGSENWRARFNPNPFIALSGDAQIYHVSGSRRAKNVSISPSGDALKCSGLCTGVILNVSQHVGGNQIPLEWIALYKRYRDLVDGHEGSFNYKEGFWRILIGDRDSQGNRPGQHIQRVGEAFDHDPHRFLHRDLNDIEQNENPVVKSMLTRIRAVTYKKNLATTINSPAELPSSIGLVPAATRAGDEIHVLSGCSVPVVLRRSFEDKYILVGEAYIYGLMDGEAWHNGDLKSISIASWRLPDLEPALLIKEQSRYSVADETMKTELPEREPVPFAPSPKDFHTTVSEQEPILTFDSSPRQYRIYWKCRCSYKGQDSVIENRVVTVRRLVQNMKDEGATVDLETTEIHDPFLDFFQQLFLTVWTILWNEVIWLTNLSKIAQPISDEVAEVPDELAQQSDLRTAESIKESHDFLAPDKPQAADDQGQGQGQDLPLSRTTGIDIDNGTQATERRAPSSPYTQKPAGTTSTGSSRAGINTPATGVPTPNIGTTTTSSPTLTTQPVGPRSGATVRTGLPAAVNDFDVFYLLLCIKNFPYLTQWTPLDVTTVRRERALFAEIQKDFYRFKRKKAWFWLTRWVSLKSVTAIKFVKFTLIEDHDLDDPIENQIPGTNDTHYHFLRTTPDSERRAPYTSSWMMHKFSSAKHCSHGTTMWERLPKRWGQTPFRDQPPDFNTAWGLLLQEGFSNKRVLSVVLVAFVIGAGFTFFWAKTHSVADAFAIGAWILALVAIFQGSLSWVDAH